MSNRPSRERSCGPVTSVVPRVPTTFAFTMRGETPRLVTLIVRSRPLTKPPSFASSFDLDHTKRQRWREESTITLTEKGPKNPKKPNSMSADRYEILLKACNAAKGEPVSVDALFRAGYRMDDVRHDAQHGFINLNQPFEL